MRGRPENPSPHDPKRILNHRDTENTEGQNAQYSRSVLSVSLWFT